MTLWRCLDQTFRMVALTCSSLGKQVFMLISAVPKRQPGVPTQSSVITPTTPPLTLFILSKFTFQLLVTTLCLLSPSRLQEVNSMINKRLKDALFSDQWSELCMDTLSPFGYVLVSTSLSLYHFISKWNPDYPVICFPRFYLFRWHPSACRECCWWFSLNSATFRSSEVCRHRVHALD